MKLYQCQNTLLAHFEKEINKLISFKAEVYRNATALTFVYKNGEFRIIYNFSNEINETLMKIDEKIEFYRELQNEILANCSVISNRLR